MGICPGSSDPCIGASGINQKCVYSCLAHLPGIVNDVHAIGCKTADSDLSGVCHYSVGNIE